MSGYCSSTVSDLLLLSGDVSPHAFSLCLDLRSSFRHAEKTPMWAITSSRTRFDLCCHKAPSFLNFTLKSIMFSCQSNVDEWSVDKDRKKNLTQRLWTEQQLDNWKGCVCVSVYVCGGDLHRWWSCQCASSKSLTIPVLKSWPWTTVETPSSFDSAYWITKQWIMRDHSLTACDICVKVDYHEFQ